MFLRSGRSSTAVNPAVQRRPTVGPLQHRPRESRVNQAAPYTTTRNAPHLPAQQPPQLQSSIENEIVRMLRESLRSISERLDNFERSRSQSPALEGGLTRSSSAAPCNLRDHQQITRTSSSIYEPVWIHNHQISVARSNANRVTLHGDKLSATNYADWSKTVSDQLA